MHEITTTITINDVTEVERIEFEFGTQEEVLDFLNDYALMELDRLYEELKAFNGRTFAFVEMHDRRSMRRVVSGKSSADDRAPIDGTVFITARRVA